MYLAITSAVFLALAEFTQQFIVKGEYQFSPRSAAVFGFGIQALIGLMLLPVFPIGVNWSDFVEVFSHWKMLLVYIAIMQFVTVCYIKSFQVKNVSISLIIIASSLVMTALLGIFFLGESHTLLKWAGIASILGAVALVTLKSVHLEPNHKYAFMAAGLLSFVFATDNYVVSQTHPLAYLVIVLTGVSLGSFLLAPEGSFAR